MKAVTKYVANDGKVFDSKKECRNYDNMEKFKKINNIKFFDSNGEVYKDIGPSNFYYLYLEFVKAIIPTVEEYKALKDIIKEYVDYEIIDIPSEGTWYRIFGNSDEGGDDILSEKDYKKYVEYLQSLLLMK